MQSIDFRVQHRCSDAAWGMARSAVVMHGRLQACDALPASLITAEIEHENVHQAGRSHFVVSLAI